MKKKEFISGVLSLTLSMLIIQSASMGFSIYVSSCFGAEQMGLFHLVMSVYSFAVTVAFSGVPLAATRLVSENFSKRKQVFYMKNCIGAGAFFGLLSCGAVFFLSPFISTVLIKTPQTNPHLKILALSLPFLAVSGVIRGYFMGVQKVACITISRMAEEFSSMFTVIALMKIRGTEGTGTQILTIAALVSSVCAFGFDIIMLRISVGNTTGYAKIKGGLKEVANISVPVAAGSYLRSGLVSMENLIIPAALSRYGAGNPLASYGTVKAMAMPVITFPYVFLQSFTSLLMPEISSRNAGQNKNSVNRVAKTALKCTLVFGIVISSFLLIFGRRLALTFYRDITAGSYITALALLSIPMFIDSVTDSLLKGLDQQVYCLKINIIDSALRVPIIYLLLPHTGVYGYIAVLYISELLNLTMSLLRLKKICSAPGRQKRLAYDKKV